jgi:hypothetical protein
MGAQGIPTIATPTGIPTLAGGSGEGDSMRAHICALGREICELGKDEKGGC